MLIIARAVSDFNPQDVDGISDDQIVVKQPAHFLIHLTLKWQRALGRVAVARNVPFVSAGFFISTLAGKHPADDLLLCLFVQIIDRRQKTTATQK